jgi:hypothetical protein
MVKRKNGVEREGERIMVKRGRVFLFQEPAISRRNEQNETEAYLFPTKQNKTKQNKTKQNKTKRKDERPCLKFGIWLQYGLKFGIVYIPTSFLLLVHSPLLARTTNYFPSSPLLSHFRILPYFQTLN